MASWRRAIDGVSPNPSIAQLSDALRTRRERLDRAMTATQHLAKCIEKEEELTKEIDAELSRVGDTVRSQRRSVDTGADALSSTVKDADVRAFLALRNASWLPELSDVDGALSTMVNECDSMAISSEKRCRAIIALQNSGGDSGDFGPTSLEDNRASLAKSVGIIRDITSQLDKSARGEDRLRPCLESAEATLTTLNSSKQRHFARVGEDARGWLAAYSTTQQQCVIPQPFTTHVVFANVARQHTHTYTHTHTHTQTHT